MPDEQTTIEEGHACFKECKIILFRLERIYENEEYFLDENTTNPIAVGEPDQVAAAIEYNKIKDTVKPEYQQNTTTIPSCDGDCVPIRLLNRPGKVTQARDRYIIKKLQVGHIHVWVKIKMKVKWIVFPGMCVPKVI